MYSSTATRPDADSSWRHWLVGVACHLTRPAISRSACSASSWAAVCVSLAAALACAPAPGPHPAHEISIEDRHAAPIFWRVTSGNAAQPAADLHLLGSIHVGPEKGWILPEPVMRAFDDADALVVEVDMSGEENEQQDDLVLRYGLLPPGESLGDHVSPDTYEALEDYLEDGGPKITTLNPMRPWMVAVWLQIAEVQRLGYPPEAGVDLFFMNLAADAAPPMDVIGLESAEEQLQMFSRMPDPVQELMLKEILFGAGQFESYFADLKEAWRNGSEAALEAQLFQELEDHPELLPFYEEVAFKRNQTMVERLVEEMQANRSLFVVVGALHLVGDRGIPAKLEAMGYHVERVHSASPGAVIAGATAGIRPEPSEPTGTNGEIE
jgi:uncharacterized protein YbaP (TraB family)